MAVDFYGKRKLTQYLGVISMKSFTEKYNVMPFSDDQVPVASNVIATGQKNNDGELLYECCIFYEVKENKQ